MPRKPRFFLPEIPVHIVQRGNNRQPIFFDDGDYRAYLNWLKEAGKRYGCDVHAYVLMTNHVHLLLTPQERDSASRALQYLGRRYVPYINQNYGRTGTLWEGRFKANLVQEEGYVMACYRYIEMNPVRAGMVASPGDYPWSSYRFNAAGEASDWLVQHVRYQGLGSTAASRQTAYRQLFDNSLPPDLVSDLRCFLQTGTPLGNDKFRERIETVLKVKIGHSTRGRPRKKKEGVEKTIVTGQRTIKGL